MTKNFLPRSVHHALVENGRQNETLPKKHMIKKCFPVVGMFFIFLGSAFLGYSFLTVPIGSVGYYPCTSCSVIKTYPPGVYLELPWKKGEMKIVDISPKNLTLGEISYMKNNTAYTTGLIEIEYKVKDINIYLRTLSAFKVDTLFEASLIVNIKNNVAIQYTTSMFEPFDLYGLTFDKINLVT